MGAIAKALGEGSEFEFEGKVYKFAPWTYGIQSSFETYLEEQAVRAAKRMAAYLHPQEAKEVMAQVQRDITAGKYTFGSEVVSEAIFSIPHFKRLIYLMLRPSHPEVSLELVDRMVEAHLEEVMAKVAEANADPTNLPPMTTTTGVAAGETPQQSTP